MQDHWYLSLLLGLVLANNPEGQWDDRPFDVELPPEKRWRPDVAKLRVDGNPISTKQLGYNLPWETGIVINCKDHSHRLNIILTNHPQRRQVLAQIPLTLRSP